VKEYRVKSGRFQHIYHVAGGKLVKYERWAMAARQVGTGTWDVVESWRYMDGTIFPHKVPRHILR
jgi:hypothetical protein